MKHEDLTEAQAALERDLCFLGGFVVKLMKDPNRVITEEETNLELLSDYVLDTLESYRKFDQVLRLMIETVKKRNQENARRKKIKLSSKWRNRCHKEGDDLIWGFGDRH